MEKNKIEVIDQYNEKKYAVKDCDKLKELLVSFKDLVASDWQLNDVDADAENYKIKQLVCTCQMLANLAADTQHILSCMHNALTYRD